MNRHSYSAEVTCWKTEHFSGKNGALRWNILVGKQKHNVQKPSQQESKDQWTFSTMSRKIAISVVLLIKTKIHLHESIYRTEFS